MFRKLIELLKKGDLMSQALEESYEMLEKGILLFEKVSRHFLEIEPLEEGFDVYAKDRELNNMERSIRRKILEHLSINPKQDIVGALVLTTVIVHIERLGDYSKNVFELSQKNSTIKESKYYERAKTIVERLFPLCERTIIVYREAVAEEAKNMIPALDDIKKECERNIEDLMEEKDISIRNAILFSLFFRYLKRVASHTIDILTSIWQPFHLIDFYK